MGPWEVPPYTWLRYFVVFTMPVWAPIASWWQSMNH